MRVSASGFRNRCCLREEVSDMLPVDWAPGMGSRGRLWSGGSMRALGRVASGDRSVAWPLPAIACLGIAIACLSGCGKSQAERNSEKAAEDARYDAAVQA